MTYRVMLGFDPGNTGAIAVLADGGLVNLFDMPTMARKGGRDVDPFELATMIRGIFLSHYGAYFHAIVEKVAMRPGNARGTDQQTGIGLGVIRGVLGALVVHWTDVYSQVWKRHHGLLGTPKDASRIKAIELWPQMASNLARKKDHGRADALLIARWGWETDQP